MKFFDRLFNFLTRHVLLGSRITLAAALCILCAVGGVVGTGAYWYLTANVKPPLTVGALVVGNDNTIRAGEEAFAYIPIQWDSSRRCSAKIQITIQGEQGEVYPAPPTVDFTKEAVDKSLNLQKSRYEFYVGMPRIARPGLAYLTGIGTYVCDDNRTAPIQLTYRDSFTILPRGKK